MGFRLAVHEKVAFLARNLSRAGAREIWMRLPGREIWLAPSLARSAERLRGQCHATALAGAFALVTNSGRFASNQKASEILSLLNMVELLRPRRICEIGAQRGGNLVLFSALAAPDARIVSIDIDYRLSRRWAFRKFAKPGQTIHCLRADSHSAECRERVARFLQGDQLDFLFVDGDHSYSGVAKDYEMYSPLVRDGGVIAFHDIVSDYRTRFGTPTETDVGDVPLFWRDLKQTEPGCMELIADAEQDGYGIGVLVKGAARDQRSRIACCFPR